MLSVKQGGIKYYFWVFDMIRIEPWWTLYPLEWFKVKLVTTVKGTPKASFSLDHPNYSIIYIGQNIEKSSWNLRRLAVT